MNKRSNLEGERRANRSELRVRVYSSFDEENTAEHRRLAEMSHRERMCEFAVLQARRWGPAWGRTPIEKRATWERLFW